MIQDDDDEFTWMESESDLKGTLEGCLCDGAGTCIVCYKEKSERKPPPPPPVCECGSAKVLGNNKPGPIHSFWCPLWKKN